MTSTGTGFSFRWGIPVLDEAMSYVPIYRFMLRNYARAGVTREEFLCITHLADYRYESEKGESRPSLMTIADQMGYKNEQSVRNLIKSLEKKSMVEVVRRPGKTSIYDFSGFAKLVLELYSKSLPDPSQIIPLYGNVPPSAIPLDGGVLHGDIPEEKEVDPNKKNNDSNDSTPLGLQEGDRIGIVSGQYAGMIAIYLEPMEDQPELSTISVPVPGEPLPKVCGIANSDILPELEFWNRSEWRDHPAFKAWDEIRKGINSGRDKYQMAKDMRPAFCTPVGTDPRTIEHLPRVIREWRLSGGSIHNYRMIHEWLETWKKLGFAEELAPWKANAQRFARNGTGGGTGNRASTVTRAGNYPQGSAEEQKKRGDAIREQIAKAKQEDANRNGNE